MKTHYIYLVGILTILISSCISEVKTPKPAPKTPPLRPQLVNWSEMNSSGWRNMSFPTWFSPALIDSNSIKNIKVSFTNFNFTDSIVNITDTLPHKTIEINFSKNGQIKEL